MNRDELYERVYVQGKCPECGNAVEELDKDTSSGRDLRFFKCTICSWSDFIDVGIALWKALSMKGDEE